jgi:hypothetical protein
MKTFRVLLVLVLLCGFSSLSWADDFRINVLDPPPTPPGNPSLSYTDITNTSSFDVVFGGCPAFIEAVVTTPSGCFTGLNDTGTTITSLTLSFVNSTNGDPNDTVTALNSQDADCDVGGLGTPGSTFVGPLFGNTTTCGLVGSTYDLNFIGTSQVPGVPSGEFFYIVEQGADPSAFGTGTGFVGLATDTPEPNSLLLLSTGVMMAGLLLFRRRSVYGQR